MSKRISLFGIEIDSVTLLEAVKQALFWLGEENFKCRYLVTPNLSHVMIWQDNLEFRKAYDNASLVLADGMPLLISSRMLKKSLPERISGVDFTEKLLEAIHEKGGGSCFLLGAGPGVAERAAETIRRRWSRVTVEGCYSPPFGFENSPVENQKIIDRITRAHPDLLIVGLGAPKQELWLFHHQNRIRAKLALCVGAAIDFLAEEKKRAPLFMQRFGFEWLHRLMMEPKRLSSRYFRDAVRFPALFWKELRK